MHWNNLAVVVVSLLLTLVATATAICNFPKFMLSMDPWVGDYLHGSMVVYVKSTYMTISEPIDGGSSVGYRRDCMQAAANNKYLVKHDEVGQRPRYICMQFFQRSHNVVQLKTSALEMTMSLSLCEERRMAIDAFPLINYNLAEENGFITCPFVGGFNMVAYFHNGTEVCGNPDLLMRMESECDKGEGLSIDFRQESCIPFGLPKTLLQRAYCVAHWTQDRYTFIVLRHATQGNTYFCMRIRDPLTKIRSAYLWFKVICDTSEVPSPEISTSFISMHLTQRVISSTCEDEMESCSESQHHICDNDSTKHMCSRTCNLCQSENQIGLCPFEEQYKGSWMESTNREDVLTHIQTYSLSMGEDINYKCIRLNEDKLPGKRVLFEILSNGCLPRYACAEMTKVTSSVMRFSLGNRLMWPLPRLTNLKAHICKRENFKKKTPGLSGFGRRRPDRLLVNTEHTQEVACNLPFHLHNGIAFTEDNTDNRVCEGCLNYNPTHMANHFIIQPTNCSIDGEEPQGGSNSRYSPRRNMPIQYSCLASFSFRNNSHSVITKTVSFTEGLGQYLLWRFTSNGKIEVLKAGETFKFEHHSSSLDSELSQGQFSIQTARNHECRVKVFLPRSTTTTRSVPLQNPYLQGHGNNNNGYDPWEPEIRPSGGHQGDDQPGSDRSFGEYGEKGPSQNGYDTVNVGEAGGKSGNGRGTGGAPEGNPRFENSRGEKDGEGGDRDGVASLYSSGPGLLSLLLVAASVLLVTSKVTCNANMAARTPNVGHRINVT